MATLLMGTAGMVASLAGALLLITLAVRIVGRSAPGSDGAIAPAGASHSPTKLPSELPREVVAALAAGRKIDAIKAYREATGCGLKEAKDACDELERATVPPR